MHLPNGSSGTAPPGVYQHVLASPEFGGAERLALAIHGRIRADKAVDSRLLVPQASAVGRALAAQGESFIEYDRERLIGDGRIGTMWASGQLLRRTWTPGRQSLLHVHAPVVFGALRGFRTLSSAKLVLHLHLEYSDQELRWAFRVRPDLVILCASFMEMAVRRLLGEQSAEIPPVVTIRNAVDTVALRREGREHQKHRLGLDPAEPVWVVAANLSPHKGQETAIRALRIVREASQRRPVLLLAGEERGGSGEYTRALQRLARDLAVDDAVRFLGFRTDLPDILGASDYLLLPSSKEGLPLVVLEAQACGAVVLASPTAGVPEVIEDGVTGFLVPAENGERYAAQLLELMEHQDRREAIASKARQFVEDHHSYPRYFEQVLSAYDRVMIRKPAWPAGSLR